MTTITDESMRDMVATSRGYTIVLLTAVRGWCDVLVRRELDFR